MYGAGMTAPKIVCWPLIPGQHEQQIGPGRVLTLDRIPFYRRLAVWTLETGDNPEATRKAWLVEDADDELPDAELDHLGSFVDITYSCHLFAEAQDPWRSTDVPERWCVEALHIDRYTETATSAADYREWMMDVIGGGCTPDCLFADDEVTAIRDCDCACEGEFHGMVRDDAREDAKRRADPA